MDKRIPSAVIAAAFAAFCAKATEMLVYYPNGETVAAPYSWQTAANWYKTNSFMEKPTVKADALPTSSQNVLIQPWGGVSVDNPVTIGAGESVTVNNLHIACNEGGSSKTPQYGASLTVDGGVLKLLGNLYFALDNHTSGDLVLKNGASMDVAGEAQLGENNYTTRYHCRMDIDATSEFNVAGHMSVGRRARCIANIVTNRGSLAVGSMRIGPCADAYAGTGLVYNVGRMVVSGNLDVGGLGRGGSGGAGATKTYYWSRGELVLDEGSTLTIGDESDIYVGGNSDQSFGDGILDVSIPLVLKGAQKMYIGNAMSNAVNGGMLVLRKNGRFDNSSSLLEIGHYQYGKAKLVMYDDSSITNVAKIRMSENSKVHSYIEMHGRSMITNINTIRLAQTTGTRTGARGHIFMDGDSAIYFTPTNTTGEGSGLIFGTTPDNHAEMRLAGNALLHGLYKMNFATDQDGYQGHLRLEGGTIMLKPHTTVSTRQNIVLGLSGPNSENGAGSISGYGTITRTDIGDVNESNMLCMNLQMHDYSVTADGCGAERDLDLRAIYVVNYIYKAAIGNNDIGNNQLANWGNLSGTNGWYAADKGRLIFPRADKVVGRTDSNPARHFGDWRYQSTNELGEAMLPTLVNAFSLEPETAENGGKAYCHSALYAPDRTDYPANVLRGRPGKVVSVWRIGTCTTGWTADAPITPWKKYTSMKVTFRYDHTVLDGGIPVKLYRHDGTETGRWTCISVQNVPAENSVISGRVTPGSGTYDLGWFALVEQRPAGSVISVR